jgi:hypothetical protein
MLVRCGVMLWCGATICAPVGITRYPSVPGVLHGFLSTALQIDPLRSLLTKMTLYLLFRSGLVEDAAKEAERW